MNKAELNEKADRLMEINRIIEKLDPEIRRPAFELLSDYVGGPSTTPPNADAVKRRSHSGVQPAPSRESFFSRFDTEKPAENALLIAAYYYSEHGSQPFGADELKRLAREVGLIVPERIDMTYRNARRDGKALLQPIGRGSFRPTVHGEVFFKTTYNVSPGRSHTTQPAESAQGE